MDSNVVQKSILTSGSLYASESRNFRVQKFQFASSCPGRNTQIVAEIIRKKEGLTVSQRIKEFIYI